MYNWHDIFYIDTSTYKLHWKIKPATHVNVGDECGSPNTDGYLHTEYRYVKYRNHQVIWEMLYGKQPKGMLVDHVDGNRQNNFPHNLRLVTPSGNAHNAKRRKDNTTGIKGLTLLTTAGVTWYFCQVQYQRKMHRKSYPYTPEGRERAIEWIRNKRNELHGVCANHGDY